MAAAMVLAPIMMKVSYGAEGAADFQARIITMTAGNEDALGMPTAIINNPGAGGRVGWNWLATRADADGNTLGSDNIPHFMAQTIEGGVSYSADSFEPVANWGTDPAVFVVAADSPFNSMKDVVDHAKANPGKVTFSGAGLFVGPHIAALQLAKAAGVNLAYIPDNKGGAGAIKAVIPGKVLGGVQNDFLPEVPTVLEQGFDIDNAGVNFRRVMMPKGTPLPIFDRLAAVVSTMVRNGRVAGKMKAGGSPMHGMTRDKVLEMQATREATLKELLAGL